MSHIEVNIKRKFNADVMTCISQSLKIAQAIEETVYLDMGKYSIPITKDSYVLDLFRIYELEEELTIKRMG